MTAFEGVFAAFREYLTKFNKGRGFVLIGHSQGSAMLEALISSAIDTNPAVRKQLVSAILLGGQVLVPEGQRRRWHLPERARLHRGHGHGLRDRLLVVPQRTA